MTNVRRPIHLQLRTSAAASLSQNNRTNNGSVALSTTIGAGLQASQPGAKQALSPTAAGSLPSQILPHLFVGAQEQTNRDTVNRLNIKYILSLGLLPMVLQQQQQPQQPQPSAGAQSPAGPVGLAPLLPSENCSRDFKVRVRSNTPSSTPTDETALDVAAGQEQRQQQHQQQHQTSPLTPHAATRSTDNENKGVKQVRSIHCKCINVADTSEQMLSKFFDEAYAFIEEARRKKCNILVHCLAGISRSPTFAIAYLMRVKALHWKDAYDLVKQCRPQIDPNLSFMGQLRLYNKSLRDCEAGKQQQHHHQHHHNNHHHHHHHNHMMSGQSAAEQLLANRSAPS